MGKLLNYLKDFKTLKGSPRELWIALILKILESYAYFATFLILTSFLTADYGYSDLDAGWTFGIVGVLIPVYGLIMGVVLDNLGVKRSLILGTAIALAARALVVFTDSAAALNVSLFILIPIGGAFTIPVLTAGLKRYTNTKNRTFAYSAFYACMNIGALLAFPSVDWLRITFENGITLPIIGLHLSVYKFVFFIAMLAGVVKLVIAATTIREINVTEKTGEIEAFKPKTGTPWGIYWETLKQSRFWRFVLLITILIGVRMVFRHMDATFPKYFVRELGKDALYGTVVGINPLLIIFLAPLLTPLVKKMSLYRAFVVGAFISAFSVFFLTIDAAYWTAILFVVFLSIGEAIWSPRLYEYTMTIAPEGREGTYTALSAAPLFAAKLLVGGVSGYMLTKYCPAGGPKFWSRRPSAIRPRPIPITLIRSRL